VTAMSRASLLSLKGTEIQKKRNIKSRKIDKRKRKMLISKAFHNKKANIKLILLTIHSGNIGSTRNGIPKNMPKFKKTKNN